MSQRDVTVFLIGIFCGGASIAGGMLTMRPLFRVEVVSTKPDSTQPRTASHRSPSPKVAYALDGYCPVTLVDKWQWTLGNLAHCETRGTQVFLFAGPAEQELFKSDPDRYLPAFSGNDVVHANEKSETIRGKREHGITYGNRIYLFATEESLQRFTQDPQLYVTTADDDRIDASPKVAVNSDR